MIDEKLSGVSGLVTQVFVQVNPGFGTSYGTGDAGDVVNKWYGTDGMMAKGFSVQPAGGLVIAKADGTYENAYGTDAVGSVGGPTGYPVRIQTRNSPVSQMDVGGSGIIPISTDGIRIVPSLDFECMFGDSDDYFGIAQNYLLTLYRDTKQLNANANGLIDNSSMVYLTTGTDTPPAVLTDGLPNYPWYQKFRVMTGAGVGSVQPWAWDSKHASWSKGQAVVCGANSFVDFDNIGAQRNPIVQGNSKLGSVNNSRVAFTTDAGDCTIVGVI